MMIQLNGNSTETGREQADDDGSTSAADGYARRHNDHEERCPAWLPAVERSRKVPELCRPLPLPRLRRRHPTHLTLGPTKTAAHRAL